MEPESPSPYPQVPATCPYPEPTTSSPNYPHTCTNKKNTYNFYLVIEVPDHVYVSYAYRLYFADKDIYMIRYFYHKTEIVRVFINPLKPELNPICYLLALLGAHHFLHVSRIRVKLLTLR